MNLMQLYVHVCIVQRLNVELRAREAQLRAQNDEMQRRNAEVSRLTRELQSCQAHLHAQQVGSQTYY